MNNLTANEERNKMSRTTTKAEAKRKTIELWTWLRDNPKHHKTDYPLFEEIKNDDSHCPLCELFNLTGSDQRNRSCLNCPLQKAGQGCLTFSGVGAERRTTGNNDNSAYMRWVDGDTSIFQGLNQRVKAAAEIVEIVSAWEVEGEIKQPRHALAPWSCKFLDVFNEVYDKNGVEILTVWEKNKDDTTALVLAAPGLLEECKNLVAEFERATKDRANSWQEIETLNRAKRIIAKASNAQPETADTKG